MRDNNTGRSRGFGFLTFKDPKTVNIVMVKEHFLDGKIVRILLFMSSLSRLDHSSDRLQIDPKRAIPRDEQEKTSKIFVGGVSQEATDQEFREYFQQFGRVVDATLMMDKDTGRPRGFGFVTFENEAGVEACINTPLEIHGKPIEVKKAQPRGNMREEEEAARRGKFRKEDGTVGTQQGGAAAGGGQANAGGVSPQVMAQYMQRMQQYFQAMQQQQMAMNRGMGGMNPMMQQMMMAQMQQQMMGRGSGGQSPNAAMMNNMNPAMMQQMMGGMGGNQGNMPQGQGGRGYGGNFDQQMPEQPPVQQQQQPQQQQQRRGRDNQHGQGYGMGGAPTSWEGMYDDVPQPNVPAGGGRGGGFHKRGGHHDPANAPPANAPTGPRNAGRPGANYRGGGRGGNRGFHPYARG